PHLFEFLVDHHCRTDTAVRVTTAGNLAPFSLWTVNEIGKVRERAHQRQREPVACRFSDTDLVLHVVRQMRERVTLLQTTQRSNLFVATGKRNRLEREERNLLWIVERKPNDRTDLIVVDAVHERGYEHDLNTRFVQVVDGSDLHIEEIANLAVTVRVVADAVKLQVNVAESGFGSFPAELFALGELDPVSRRLHAVVTNFARVLNRFEKMRRN